MFRKVNNIEASFMNFEAPKYIKLIEESLLTVASYFDKGTPAHINAIAAHIMVGGVKDLVELRNSAAWALKLQDAVVKGKADAELVTKQCSDAFDKFLELGKAEADKSVSPKRS